ncbi:MAG: VOC family protein [Alphaproteobacteria bacterium]|nr:VOC family protein [Alphaproteobacteria bacterium]
MTAPVLTAFSAVFTVSDVSPSLRFYVEKLGFKIHFQMGDPPSYAIIERAVVSLHLMPKSRDPSGLGTSSIYVFVAGIDALHDELTSRDCPIEVAPEDFSYGMREVSVRDPDGNRLTFGEEIKPA